MVLTKLTVSLSLATAISAVADANTSSYSPPINAEVSRSVFWGDLHLHTNYSVDANTFGNRTIDPALAYQFARGAEVTANNGMRVKLRRALDFLAITDHGEYLGLMGAVDNKDPRLSDQPILERWRNMRASGEARGAVIEWSRYTNDPDNPPLVSQEFTRSVWLDYARIADRNNDPRKFTTFVAYEWSASWGGGSQHRNIIFKDGAEEAGKILPFTAIDSNKPEDLWAFLNEYEAAGDGEVLAIPHNPNLSGGYMFSPLDSNRKPFTRDYAKERSRWEPIVEATQYKGDSESHPFLSPKDKFADFEDWDWSNSRGSKAHQDSWFKGEYVREALKTGLAEYARLGINPFKFGLIGSTDSHTGLSTAEEDNWWGKMSQHEPKPLRYTMTSGKDDGASASIEFSAWRFLASGIAAVWAEENTRESLFRALQRKEVFATTGPRIMLRVFGGWDFDKLDATDPDFSAIGYRRGVPMGGNLTVAPKGRSPRFLIVATKDPIGANLERVQVVKGWIDSKGEARERIWDVVLSDDRKPGEKMASAAKSTVDIKTATYHNTVGDPQMATVWEDPDFDANQDAFYYVRVLEIPTPRWTSFDAAFYDTKLPHGVPAQQQERAYSSPIWYTP